MFGTDKRSPELTAAQRCAIACAERLASQALDAISNHLYCYRCFQDGELAELRERFDAIAGPSKKLDVADLQEFLGVKNVDAALAAQLHVAVARGNAIDGVSLDDVTIAKVCAHDFKSRILSLAVCPCLR